MTLKDKLIELVHENVLCFENQESFYKSERDFSDSILQLIIDELPKRDCINSSMPTERDEIYADGRNSYRQELLGRLKSND